MIDQINWAQMETSLNQKSSDWKKREESLQLLIDRLNSNDQHSIEFVARNAKAVALQLNDLRSALVKLASTVIKNAAQRSAELQLGTLEKFTDVFFRDANLIKALGCANKVINIHAATAFRALFEYNQVSLGTLEAFYIANKDTKNNNVRERIAEAFGIFVGNLGKAKERKIKTEGLNFLRKAIEFLIKDANGNVRTSAKKTKVVLEKIEDSMMVGGLVSSSMEEETLEARTMSKSREIQKSKNRLNLSHEKSKTLTIARWEPSKGMEIENNDTLPSRHLESGPLKKDAKKPKVRLEGVIDTLENPKKQIKEKVEQISKMNLEDFYTNCECEDYKKLLGQYQYAKNFEFKKLVVKLIEGVKISKFMAAILNYAEKETLDKKINYSFFISRLLQEELIEFLEYFLFRNNAFSLRLLQKRFDLEEFENIIADNPDLVHSLLTLIHQNVTGNMAEGYIKLNIGLLENIYQSTEVVTQHKHYPFNEAFFEKVQSLNPELYNFLQDQQLYLGEKIVFRPNKNNVKVETQKLKSQVGLKKESRLQSFKTEKEVSNPPAFQKENSAVNTEEAYDKKDLADSKFEALMNKANSQTKKTVLRSILAHLKHLHTSQENAPIEKVFNKNLEVLKHTFDPNDLDDELINLGCKLIEEMHKLCEKDQMKRMIIYDIIFDLIKGNFNFKDRVVEYIVGSSLRFKFFTHAIMFVDNKVTETVVDGLHVLSNLFKTGKGSYSFVAFHKEVVSLLGDLTKVIRELFVHPEVSVRKNVVQFIVQCHFFMEQGAFSKMFYEFPEEQQKLVDLYIKKTEV